MWRKIHQWNEVRNINCFMHTWCYGRALKNFKKKRVKLTNFFLKASQIEEPQTVIVNGNDVPMVHTVTYHGHMLLSSLWKLYLFKIIVLIICLVSGSVTRVGSGVYIGTTWVLTVAQNLRNDLTEIRCGFGNRDRNQLTWVTANNFISHPLYNATNLDNNIGLVALSTNPTLLPTIFAIPLSVPLTPQEAGIVGIIYGFGFTANGGNFAQILQQGLKVIQTDAECLTTYPHLVGRLDTNFCARSAAGDNAPSMCGGDQGGPFVVNNVVVIF